MPEAEKAIERNGTEGGMGSAAEARSGPGTDVTEWKKVRHQPSGLGARATAPVGPPQSGVAGAAGAQRIRVWPSVGHGRNYTDRRGEVGVPQALSTWRRFRTSQG